jgi:uncharacterized protein YuzE
LEATLKVFYDLEVDVLRVIFRESAIAESDEEKPGIILDYDETGSVIALEILDASSRVENPGAVEYATV